MRVSFRNQYSDFLYHVQNTQSRLMELNMQGSSQKRINKPSDDAIGAGRVLNYRESISTIDQYRDNINTAKGWLGLADDSMLQVSTVLSKLRGLAEQGATGTMTASDRNATAYEVRQLFSQLISLSNTKYQGNSIFAGHKVSDDAYAEGLMAYKQDGKHLEVLITGATSRSMIVQFLGEEGTSVTVGESETIDYQYSDDGGKTWKVGTLADGATKMDLGGVSVQLRNGEEFQLSPSSNTQRSQGSWLTIAPTGIYKGDHESQSAVTYDVAEPKFTALPLGGFEQDVKVTLNTDVTFGADSPAEFGATVETMVNGVLHETTWTVPNLPGVTTPVLNTPYGGIQLSGTADAGDSFDIKANMTGVQNLGADVNAMGKGVFHSNIMVRIDNEDEDGSFHLNDEDPIKYSYSTDGGVNWSTGHTAPNGETPELPVPGGTLRLSSDREGNTELPKGAQFIIHPQTASHNVEISAGQYIQLNNVGAQVFGGHYEHGTEPVFADSDQTRNIFVSVGKLVAALENNDQTGCSQALEDLRSSQQHFSTQMASVGARENRLDVADMVLSGLKLNEKSRMSAVEDVDLTELMTELANQQLSYEAVLKSSSMIMKMSLVNYI